LNIDEKKEEVEEEEEEGEEEGEEGEEEEDTAVKASLEIQDVREESADHE